ncbi:MAG: DNA primase [Calditrichaceae bacterium]
MGKISEDKIDEIRTSINIVHYISQFVNLKKTGVNHKGLCPFHQEKTPSFTVNPEKQIFHCFGCGKGGNIYTFIMDYEKLNFPDAIRKAADFAGISMPADEYDKEETTVFQQLFLINRIASEYFINKLNSPANKNILNYFLNRKISPETIREFGLGYAPDSYNQTLNELKKNKLDLKQASELGLIQKKDSGNDYYDKFRHRIMFPFYNLSGKIIGFGGRKLKEEQQPKYLNSPESPIYKKSELLYGLHQAINSIRQNGFVILVEGYFDLLRLVDSGIKNVVASSGTALAPQQAKLIRRYCREVYIAYDGDDAGVKAAIRNANIIETEDLNSYIIPLPKSDDPDTFILKYGQKEFENLLKKKTLPIEFQINSFFTANPDPSLEQKDIFIQSVLQNLSVITNQIKVGLYLHQISDRLDINENLLVGQLNRLKREGQKYKKEESSPVPKKKTLVRRGIYKAEEGLIGLLLTGSDDSKNFIIAQSTREMFENDEFIMLFDHIMNELEEHGTIDITKLLDSIDDDEETRELTSRLVVSEWADSPKFIADCLYQLKKWQLEKKAAELSTLIKVEANSDESVLHYTKELTMVRKEIALLENQRKLASKF